LSFPDGRWKSAVNMVNPLGTKGNIVRAFSSILHTLWHGEMPFITPFEFRVCTTPPFVPQVSRTDLLTFGILALRLPACPAIRRFRAARFAGVSELLAGWTT
jgi:hypothetical protein